jgi:hypothetical protein
MERGLEVDVGVGVEGAVQRVRQRVTHPNGSHRACSLNGRGRERGREREGERERKREREKEGEVRRWDR